ncbi:hypothetical protein [Aurantivibrio plasticivorans]
MTDLTRSIFILIFLSLVGCVSISSIGGNKDDSLYKLEPVSVQAVPGFPGEGVIENLRLVHVSDMNGNKVLPKTTEEAVGLLKLVFDEKLKSVLRNGVVMHLDNSNVNFSEADLDGLWESINVSLDSAYSDFGLSKGAGLSLIFSELSTMFELNYFGSSEYYGELQLSAANKGLSYPSDILYFILLNYFDEIDIDGYEGKVYTKKLIEEE